MTRLETAAPKKVDTHSFAEWLVFADAAFEREAKPGGLGAESVKLGFQSNWTTICAISLVRKRRKP